MKKEVIALAFSDIHLNNWTKFNQNGSRTDSHFLILDKIFREAIKQKIPVFFCGDLVHTPETINMELYIKMSKHFDKYSNEPKLQVFGVSGNHEIPNLNTYDQRSDSFLTALDLQYHWFHCMDWKTIQWPTFALHGIPYLDHNIGLKQALKETKVIKGKKNILLLHTDYAGARDTDGREVGSVENFDRTLLRKFDLVLCGHIHKFQKLEKHVYMVGAPLQQRFTDEGNKMGYLKIYSDTSIEFVHIKGLPKFKTVGSVEEIKEDGNYYRVLKPKASNDEFSSESKVIQKNYSKVKAGRRYLRIQGIKDPEKKRLLIEILKKAEEEEV